MKKTLSFIVLLLFSNGFLFSQVYKGQSAQNIVAGAEIVKIDSKSSIPSYVKFRKGSEVDFINFALWLKKTYKLSDEYNMKFIRQQKDELNNIHYCYYQTFNNIPIHDAQFIVHVNNQKIYSINGTLYNNLDIDTNIILNEQESLDKALNYVNAEKYKWQIPQEEEWLKKVTNNPQATYFPKGELAIVPDKQGKHRITYKYDIYSAKPLSRVDIYVDAITGEIIFINRRLKNADVQGTAVTKYNGTQTIITDSYNSIYRLREAGRNVETYNMLQGTDYSAAVDFTDDDNYWNNFNAQYDEAATDAHWGAEMTYDYYLTKHNRNSIDDNGMKLLSYVHYDVNYSNAFWDGQSATYGDGNGNPFCALDVCAHEFTHGVTEYTADLNYVNDESGALNEGFSDIFAVAVEFFAKPSQANWTMGEDLGFIIRNVANPNATENPDTYLGDYWDPQQEQHQNSTVLSHWFYLVSQGGSGTNDNGDAYSVNPLGIDNASKVAYRTLAVYLTNTSEYADARFYSIISAIDLFGPCSPEVETVTNAWYAVGVGNAYVDSVISDFSADFTAFCSAPAMIGFINESSNGISFFWDFGDGSTSTEISPTHTYNALGTYNVTLIADGGACGSDTIIKVNFINIDTTLPCIVLMPHSGQGATQTSCFGTLYDDGGTENYTDNMTSSITIAPIGAASVILNFISFSFEQDYDYLHIYDGPDMLSPLIGSYTGSSLPNGGIITSTASAITIVQETDQAVNKSGFELNWACNMPNSPPSANFSASPTTTCTGTINFHDLSTNGPTSWYWHFGDGTSDIVQNPTHTYTINGTYTVTLVASNAFGSDTIIQTDIVTINHPAAPEVINGSSCGPGTVTLSAIAEGTLYWYNSISGGNLLDTGVTFTTPYLTTTTTYYVEELIDFPSQYVGPYDNTIGDGGYYNSSAEHYLIFDCYTDLTLVSVKVFAQGTDNRQIWLENSTGTVIYDTTINIPNGENRIYLNFDIPAGNNYRLRSVPYCLLYRNLSGAEYPYTIADMVSITSSSGAGMGCPDCYYYFYDWEVKKTSCISERAPVTAFIDTLQPIANFSYIENDPTISFINSSLYASNCYWDFGDGATSISQNPIHTYTANGTYLVTLIASNDCGADTITDTVYINSVSINEKDLTNSINIFPNPADDYIILQVPSSEFRVAGYEFRIYDLLGNVVIRGVIPSGARNLTILCGNLQAGIYFIHVLTEKVNFREKIIIY